MNIDNQEIPEYDGFFFLPGKNPKDLSLNFFKVMNYETGNPIESTDIGDKYHIAMFNKNPENTLIPYCFEAILGDPITYIKNLTGTYTYGCVLRKTENSNSWFSRYIEQVKNSLYKAYYGGKSE